MTQWLPAVTGLQAGLRFAGGSGSGFDLRPLQPVPAAITGAAGRRYRPTAAFGRRIFIRRRRGMWNEFGFYVLRVPAAVFYGRGVERGCRKTVEGADEGWVGAGEGKGDGAGKERTDGVRVTTLVYENADIGGGGCVYLYCSPLYCRSPNLNLSRSSQLVSQSCVHYLWPSAAWAAATGVFRRPYLRPVRGSVGV